LIKFFQPPPPIGDVIFQTIRKLKFQNAKLEQVSTRLRERDRVLFQACVMEVRRKRKDRAAICANELSEVRKLFSMVVQCQLALERVILRLETIKEVSEIFADLKPVLRSLSGITQNLINVMPDVAQELERVNESISETLAMTRIDTPQPIASVGAKTEAGDEILREVSSALERRLKEELPAPPIPVAQEKVESRENVKQMVALAATCSTSEQIECQEGEPPTYVTYKDLELQRVSFTIQRKSSLEDAILQYAKECKGEIDIEKCALDLNVPSGEVVNALESLGTKGKITIQR